jgi:hypothetical protein
VSRKPAAVTQTSCEENERGKRKNKQTNKNPQVAQTKRLCSEQQPE